MGLTSLSSGSRVYIDTQFSVYSVESNPRYDAVCRALWNEFASLNVSVHVSELSLHECLVLPLRNTVTTLIDRYDSYFESPPINLPPVSRKILRRASSIRAPFPRIKTPDAIHIASAEEVACATIVTNDLAWKSCTSIPLIILDDLRSASP